MQVIRWQEEQRKIKWEKAQAERNRQHAKTLAQEKKQDHGASDARSVQEEVTTKLKRVKTVEIEDSKEGGAESKPKTKKKKAKVTDAKPSGTEKKKKKRKATDDDIKSTKKQKQNKVKKKQKQKKE